MNTLTCKFSDIPQSTPVFELHVGTCAEPPKHFDIYSERRTDFFSVSVFVSGHANIKLNLKEQRVARNNVLFLVPNTTKQLIDKSDDMNLYTVIFTTKFLLQVGIEKHEIEMIDFTSRTNESLISLSDKELDTLKKIIADLKEKNDNIDNHPFGKEIVKYTFRIFLSEMAGIAVKYNLTKHTTSRKQDLVMQFGNLVNLNFKENRSVKFYADQLAITPKYLTEIVHDVTGESASVIIDEKVMYEAKLLLNNPRLTISQIADALHFSDQSFLGKFFKRHLGLSPSQYRNHKLA